MYIGIDLGGTNIAVGLVGENGNILHKDSVPTCSSRHYTEIIKDMAMLSMKVVEDAGHTMDDVKAVGIGSPGTPDAAEGMIVYANNLNFYHVPMRTEFQKYINLPVYIENDANCAALAEAVAGAAKDVRNSITITLGTGVGSGIIIDQKIYSGFNYAGGEFGHTVVQMDGEPCTCGRKGCWETYASATAFIRQTREAISKNPDSLMYDMVAGDLDKVNGKTAFDAAKQGDDTAKRVVDNYIRFIAVGVANAINVFQPQAVVIGGGISKEGEYLLEPLRKYVYEEIYCKELLRTEIKAALLGNDAGIIGAAMLCR